MNWYYESGGQQQGPATDQDLDRLLAEGKITPDTLVWREGLPGWTPLRTARAAAPSAPVPPPPPAGSPADDVDAGWEVTRPAQPIPAATGSDYPQPGWIKCSATGRYFPPSEIIYLDGKPYSAAAKPQVVASLQSGGALPTGGMASGQTGPAWEQRASLGLMKAIIETVKAVLLQPVPTFTNMQRTGGLGSPITYYLLTGGVGAAVNQVWGVMFQGAAAGLAAAGSGNSSIPGLGMSAGLGVIGIFVAPIFGILGLFIMSGLIHLSLMMLKGANQPFETTFRTVAFAYGSGGVLSLIPVCGSVVGGLWALVTLCIGMGPAHGTTTGKGVGGVLLPFLICCVLIFGFYAVIAGVAAAAFSHR